jgi:phage shock protein A
MSESLASRVGRIIAGGFHALVDAVENAAPESVMEQAIREIESAIADVRADLGKVEAQRHLSAKRLAEEGSRHEVLTEQAQLALEQGREDLASAAVERQIDIESQLPILESRLTELAEDKSRLEGYVTALLAKKREMREALADFRKAQEQTSMSSSAGGAAAKKDSASARAERATDAFDRIFQRQSGLSATRNASERNVVQLAELEELARRNRIQERLAELKARS